jgi:small GTP-binding protein
MSQETTLKVIVLGSSNVGKTSVLRRAFDDEFNPTISTIGVDFKTQYFKFDDTSIRINYIDTAGQEKFKAISVNYLKGADGAILVYDITKEETFKLIGDWVEDIKQNNKMNIGKVLLGNKADLDVDREVSKERGESLAKELDCPFFETSALSGMNVREAVDEIAKITYNKWKLEPNNRKSVRLSSSSSVEKIADEQKKKNCC